MLSFEEEQHFSRALLNTLLLLMAVFVLIMWFALGVVSEEGRQAVFATLIFSILFMVFFFTLKLNTQVTGEGIHLRTLYVVSRLIRFNDIVSAEDVQYRPIRDYGGWGIRFSRKGMAYNMSGNHGVKLKLKNGKRVLIGSQRSAELAMAIKSGKGQK